MIEHLKECKFVLFTEADGIFKELMLPLEWQMNYWNFTKETNIAIASDPLSDLNKDSHGNMNLDLGFVLAQNTERTFEIWEGWNNCLDDSTKFPDCQKWAYNWPAEQGAYSSIIRYKYSEPGDLLIIPCDEANGYPESDTGCHGTLNYQHYWLKKDTLKDKAVLPTVQLMMQGLQLDILLRKDQILQEKGRSVMGENVQEEKE
jgi:hypothetical protein